MEFPDTAVVLYRDYRLVDVQLRDPDETGDGQYTLIGHAAVFDLPSLPLYDWWFGEYTESLDRGAFDPVLSRNPDVHLVYQHDMASAMARTVSKTLELSVDPRGLRTYARLDPSDLDVQRVAPKMRRGDVNQMSFAFTVQRDEWTIENEGTDQEKVSRKILEVGDLFDVSIVPQGAYPQTDAGLRQKELRGVVTAAVAAGQLPELMLERQRRAGSAPAGAGSVAPDDPVGDQMPQRARRVESMRQQIALLSD